MNRHRRRRSKTMMTKSKISQWEMSHCIEIANKTWERFRRRVYRPRTKLLAIWNSNRCFKCIIIKRVSVKPNPRVMELLVWEHRLKGVMWIKWRMLGWKWTSHWPLRRSRGRLLQMTGFWISSWCLARCSNKVTGKIMPNWKKVLKMSNRRWLHRQSIVSKSRTLTRKWKMAVARRQMQVSSMNARKRTLSTFLASSRCFMSSVSSRIITLM